MIQQFLVRLLLSPFAFLYGIGVGLRDLFYRTGVLKAVEFDVPTISVGNLSVGGAGKSPHIEYLTSLLREYINLGILSRGYQRKTKGYREVRLNDDALQAGDEPLQFKRKYPDVLVVVSESRTFAIPKMIADYPQIQCVLLDDAFQHRAIKPGLNILLTEFDRPYTKDWLLPSGRLRENQRAADRADLIVVSKCPPVLPQTERSKFLKNLKPRPHQKVFFSYYNYFQAYHLFRPDIKIPDLRNLEVLLICAIANTDYLIKYLNEACESVETLEYEDHHYFDKYDLSNLKRRFDKMDGSQKIIITTEKDAMRLQIHSDFILENQLPIFVLPIQVVFHDEDGNLFDNTVRQYLMNFTV
ncbi:MAG: tetraacyldisaccharide 4'-kinase [Saprospiraceae bacterium]|nr:tetraacyldisaccharide 4'-kinase [Saprospiraceae bacterium]